MKPQFSSAEKALLAIAQSNLPDSLSPYADMARECGMEEAEVTGLLKSLKKSGAIRRFGATIRHHRAGWGANAMVAWKAKEEEADACGAIAAAHPNISHAYFRPGKAPDWEYSLYTMIHGRDEGECLAVVDWLLDNWPLREYAILRTRRELKKISMSYFS